jgi:hypothetical protein
MDLLRNDFPLSSLFDDVSIDLLKNNLARFQLGQQQQPTIILLLDLPQKKGREDEAVMG